MGKFINVIAVLVVFTFCSCNSESLAEDQLLAKEDKNIEVSVNDAELKSGDVNAFCHKIEKDVTPYIVGGYAVECVSVTRGIAEDVEADILLRVSSESLSEEDDYYVRVTPIDGKGEAQIFISKNGCESAPITAVSEMEDGSCVTRFVFPQDCKTRATYKGNYGTRVMSCVKAVAGSDIISIVGYVAVFSNTARIVWGSIMAVGALACMAQ